MCLSIGACDLLEVDPTSVITSDSWQNRIGCTGMIGRYVCEIEDRIRGEPFSFGANCEAETLESEAIVG